MSNVTNAILTHAISETEAVNELQRGLEEAGITSGQFTRVNQYATGPKGMEIAVHVAGFNHLDEPALIWAIRSVRWERPSHVQLFLERQDDIRFSEVDVFGQYEPNRQQKLASGKGLNLSGPEEQRQFHFRLPTMLADFRRRIEEIEQNPLRTAPWPRRVTQAIPQEPWVFEILNIHAERFFSSYVPNPSPSKGTIHERHRVFWADLAYRGAAARLTCDSADVGDAKYDQAKTTLATVDVEDLIEFMGTVNVDEDGIWRLINLKSLRKMN